MTLKERNMLYRIYKALNAVPGANIGGGMQTTTVSGVVNFGADISKVREHCSRALEALFDGALSKEDRDVDFEEAMERAEEFIKRRADAHWCAR